MIYGYFLSREQVGPRASWSYELSGPQPHRGRDFMAFSFCHQQFLVPEEH